MAETETSQFERTGGLKEVHGSFVMVRKPTNLSECGQFQIPW